MLIKSYGPRHSVSGSANISEMNQSSKILAFNLGALLDATDAALITLDVGEMQLAVHKSVLVAKSPVFAAMLAHDTVEARSGHIVITDIKPKVLQQLVLFMYKGSAPRLYSMAPQLLVAADKYCMPDLKVKCEHQMVRDLSVESVITSALIALRHSCPRLKESCGIFIRANFTKVTGTEGWAEAVSRYPEEFVEVSRLVASKPARTRSDSQELDQELLKAAENNKVKEVQQLLARGADVGAQDARGRTALHCAASYMYEPNTMRVLLQSGADLEAQDKSGRTPLHYAAASGAHAAAKWLLKAGARVEATDRGLQTPLHCAALEDNDVVKELLGANSDVNAADVYGCTPLHLVALSGSEYTVKALLDVGADKNARNNRGETPMQVAELCNVVNLLDMLSVSDSVSMSETNNDPKTPACDLDVLLEARDAALITLVAGETQLVVHRSVLVAKSPVFAAMLPHDTVNASSSRIAILDVKPKVLQQLLVFMYKGSTPQLCSMAPQLLVAADKYGIPDLKAQCEQELVRHLSVENVTASALLALRHLCTRLKESCSIFIRANFKKVLGTEGWAEAVRKHPEEFVEVSHLLAKLAKTRRVSQEEKNRKMLKAAANHKMDEMEKLLSTGADLRARDARGRTVVHLTAHLGSCWPNLHSLLLDGADVGAQDECGRTALHYAAATGYKETIQGLLQAGALVDARDMWLRTPLHIAIFTDDEQVVQPLVEASTDVNTADMYGDTPLHLAAQRNSESAVKALLNVGADKYIRNDEKETPLDVAERYKRKHLLALLR